MNAQIYDDNLLYNDPNAPSICNVVLLLIACNFHNQAISGQDSENRMQLVTKQRY